MRRKAPLAGIDLEEQVPFRTWAESILPWLREVMADVAEGISSDIADLLARQERYTGYQGALVEIYARAQSYYITALAEAMERALKREIPTSLVARVAEGECKTERRLLEAIHRLNSTLADQLMAIASRLKYEGVITWGDRGGHEKPR
ncbi:MAG: hypothetical protein N2Z74_07850 [Syntrophales bacterium]|nr:hypothetical protein [Syntrophales bacterium]